MMTRRTSDWSDEVKVGTSADLTNDAAGVSHSIEQRAACLVTTVALKFLSHSMFGYMYEVLNID